MATSTAAAKPHRKPSSSTSTTPRAAFVSGEQRLALLARVNAIVRPVFQPKGYKWEYNIYEHPARNWRVNGLVPPVERGDTWQQWVDQNNAVPYDEVQAPPEGKGVVFNSLISVVDLQFSFLPLVQRIVSLCHRLYNELKVEALIFVYTLRPCSESLYGLKERIRQ